MDLILTDVTVTRIREDVYNLLDIQGDTSYDYHHVRHVELYAKKLSKQRHLDINVGIAIALMHDLGRIKGGIYGKEHAAMGAQIAKKWLKKLDVAAETSCVITTAIMNHNQKKNIQDSYSELIKDADSLAHKDELQDELPRYERIRSEIARISPMRIDFASLEQAIFVFNKQMSEIIMMLDIEDEGLLTGSCVHEFRIAIRSIRAVLTLVSDEELVRCNKLEKALKKIFKLFEDSRKLTVFQKSLKRAGLSKSDYSFLKVLIERENAKIILGFRNIKNKYEAQFHDSYDSILNEDEAHLNFERNLFNYNQAFQMVRLDEMESLHQLRIHGKNFKYLIENEVLTIGEPIDLELINELHMAIGRLHDIGENMKLLVDFMSTGAIKLKDKQALMVTGFYKSGMSEELQNIRRLVFRFRKRLVV